ncbi:MAG TPA: hypothetical protein VFZ72_19865, partial [Jiangellaceae bacterium]
VARYERAWRSPGTDALDELFTHTASYSPSPWAQPIDGVEAIRRFWDASRKRDPTPGRFSPIARLHSRLARRAERHGIRNEEA